MRTAICTIIAKNYLPFARVLMASVRQWIPQALRIVILVDRVDGYFNPAQEDYELIVSEDLNLPQPQWFHFKYTIIELSTAVKPYALEYLFRRYQLDRLIYFDPDIKVYARLEPLLQMLERYSIVLTPHLTEALEDQLRPTELDILRSGAYNLGFIALASSDETFRFLKWWQERVYDQCVVDLARGLFVDQRWVDLVPGLFQGVGINREPGYNVAYWNIKHRKIHRTPDGYLVNGRPLYFFHFSGFDPDNPSQFSRHQNRYRLADLGEARLLVLEYREDLLAHGYSQCKNWPYAYGSFENGFPIPDPGRPLHHEAPELVARIGNPFSDEGFRAFLDTWNQPVATEDGQRSGVTRLAYRIYRTRSDVQAAMPDIFGGDLVRFLEWVLSSGRSEHALDEAFVAPISDALEGARQRYLSHPATPDWDASLRKERGGLSPQVWQALEASTPNGVWVKPGGPHTGQETLNELIEAGGAGLRLSRLARALYESRPDVQHCFPDPCGRDALKFLTWFLTYAKKEYRLDEVFLAPLRDQWVAVLNGLHSSPARMWYRAVFRGMAVSVGLRDFIRQHVGRIRFASSLLRARRRRAMGRGPSARGLRPWPAVIASDSLDGRRPHLGVNLVGYLHSETGVGESARCTAVAARQAGLPVRLKSVDGRYPCHMQDDRAGSDSESFPYAFNLFYVNADQAAVVVERVGAGFTGGKYNIGYWAWELEDFPDRWASSFDYFQEIWTPSTFCQDSIARKSPIPVVRMPHAIRVESPALLDRAAFGIPLSKFVFLTVFDMLSVFERKNPLAVIAAFREAFGNRSNCHLVVKINHADQHPRQLARVWNASAGYPITIIDRTINRSDLNALLQCCDCFVSLHRSEGFGLTIAEAMYLGKPVIVTAYSGNMDFTNPANAFLVGYRFCSIGADCDPYDAGLRWADPSIEEASAEMKRVCEQTDLRQRRAMAGSRFVREHLSPEAVGKLMKTRLELLSSQLCRAGTAGTWVQGNALSAHIGLGNP